MKIELPNYIGGKFKYNPDTLVENTNVLNDPNRSSVAVHLADEWDIIAAIETTSRTHKRLKNFADLQTLYWVLKKAVNQIELDETIIAEMTGSPASFVKERINETKQWINDSHNFLSRAISSRKLEKYGANPTFAILPSNSEQEALFVIAQAIAAKSPLIIRASSSGVSSYTAIKFVEAWRKALDSKEIDDEYLREAINVINTKNADELWKNISINDWNYVCFGSGETINKIRDTISSYNVKPRKIISYGSNLSCTIIDKSILDADKNLELIADELLVSASVNRGNECVATRIAYIHEDIFDQFRALLEKDLSKFKSADPLSSESIGIVRLEDVDYIENILMQQGKINCLNVSYVGKQKTINTSLVPLTKYEYAQELPGPVLYLKKFSSKTELRLLMEKELEANNENKFLVCSVYSSKELNDEFGKGINTYKIRYNKPSHEVDLYKPHQGIVLLEELVDPTVLE